MPLHPTGSKGDLIVGRNKAVEQYGEGARFRQEAAATARGIFAIVFGRAGDTKGKPK